MAGARDFRRSALQALYQFDAAGDPSSDERATIRESLDDGGGDRHVHDTGFKLAVATWERREAADADVSPLTPEWPIHRQPVIDRNILRLAHYEMTVGETPPKVAINEAVELAREFSTEKSPLFVNGVLDRLFRQLRGDEVETDASLEELMDPAEKPDVDVPVAPAGDERETVEDA